MATQYNRNLNSLQHVEVPFNYVRGNPLPVDDYSVWTNYTDAQDYAQNNPVAYVGLNVYVVDTIKNCVSSYVIKNTAGDLEFQVDKTYLSSELKKIWEDVKGGVNYKGHLKLTDDALGGESLDLTGYLSAYYSKEGKTSEEIANMNLSNGWMYYIDFNPEASWDAIDPDKGTFTTRDGVVFVPGNYIIVHSHNAAYIDGVPLTATTSANIDIVRVTDSDLVRFNDLLLSVNGLTGIISSTSATLSDALTAARSDINTLSTDVNDILCAAIDNKVILSSLNTAGASTTSNIDTLIINRMTAAQYALLATAGNIADDLLYTITDDEINAFGKRIVSVATPNNNEDAVNKQYVDDNISELSVPKLSARFDAAFETGANGDEKLTMFNDNNPSYKYLLQMLSGTLVLKLKS